MKTQNITISPNIKVTIPVSLHLMTTYILLEQQDWFEDEIKFIRKIIKPGMRVIDIGANYGLYSLSMAVKTGEDGKVWAFEPTLSVASCLSQSIAENKLHNIELIQAGMFDYTGRAKLYINPNSELNSLIQNDNTKDNNFEMVDLFTLDECREKYNWKEIDFIKLDAEGVETNIINAGEKALAVLSPLIMYELKHGEKLNLPLIQQFEDQGYNNYYLIPALNLLVPFDKSKPFDTFLLNLFCCKKDKAAELEKEGFLINSFPSTIQSADEINSNRTIWKDYISKLPYSHLLCNEWEKQKEEHSKADRDLYQIALNSYTLSKSEDISPFDRFWYLKNAYNTLNDLIKGEVTFPQLMSLARIAYELGERRHAVEILATLINKFSTSIQNLTGEPFLPVCQRYEGINPESRLKEWVISSILEQYEKLHAFSSYYTGQNSLQILKKLKTLGFQSPEMERRLQLIQNRFNIKTN